MRWITNFSALLWWVYDWFQSALIMMTPRFEKVFCIISFCEGESTGHLLVSLTKGHSCFDVFFVDTLSCWTNSSVAGDLRWHDSLVTLLCYFYISGSLWTMLLSTSQTNARPPGLTWGKVGQFPNGWQLSGKIKPKENCFWISIAL